MYHVLSILPSGHLHVRELVDEQWEKQALIDKKVMASFDQGQAPGLVSLVAAREYAAWPQALIFWREFAARYINALCRVIPTDAEKQSPLPAPLFHDTLIGLPPMPGAEYASLDFLESVWVSVDDFVSAEIKRMNNGVTGFLMHHLPQWHQVGRVCFHLAENKSDAQYPFAFLATYAPRVGKSGRLQYQALSHALKEYAGDKNKDGLLHLLKPIYKASKQCGWVHELMVSGDVYHPMRWTPDEAFQLLNSVSQLEESGVVTRLPDWWKKKPRAKVQVVIGSHKNSQFGADALLDFQVNVAIDGEALTQEEISAMLASGDGLMMLRGQWVEVDNDKLQEALNHWQMVKEHASEDGLSFIEGMRLLSGASADLSKDDEFDEDGESWAFVQAGDWLKNILDGLRAPGMLTNKHPGDLLQATLRHYQQQGLDWLHFLSELGLGACLADDMGLGKTIQVLALLLVLKKQATSKQPHLIVLPASLLSNWKAEINRFAPSLNALYLHASELKKADLQAIADNRKEAFKSIDVVLTTYGMLQRQEWMQKQAWDLVILDEAQAIKNPTSRQSKSVKTLKSRSRIALTGTPVENRLGDLWSLYDFLCPGLLGGAARFKQYIKGLESSEGNNPYAPLRRLVQPYILRRLKTDKSIISDLPDKTEVTAWCGLTKAQAKLYAQSVAELKDALESTIEGMKRRGLVLSYLMRFKQICNHPSQLLGDQNYTASQSGKYSRLGEICDEIAQRQEKVLIFTQFREMTEPLANYLETIFGEPGLVLHGGTPVKKRKEYVDAFQDESGPPFFILSLKAGGTGLNLTAASHVVHFDRWWNPAVENQATDRAFRIGQKKNVLVHKFVCRGTLEEKIDKMISDKKQLADGVLKGGGGEALLTELDDKALINLVSLNVGEAEE